MENEMQVLETNNRKGEIFMQHPRDRMNQEIINPSHNFTNLPSTPTPYSRFNKRQMNPPQMYGQDLVLPSNQNRDSYSKTKNHPLEQDFLPSKPHKDSLYLNNVQGMLYQSQGDKGESRDYQLTQPIHQEPIFAGTMAHPSFNNQSPINKGMPKRMNMQTSQNWRSSKTNPNGEKQETINGSKGNMGRYRYNNDKNM